MKCLLLTLCVFYLSFTDIQCNVAQSARAEIPLFEVPGPTWGNIAPPYYFHLRVTKYKVPFITRCSSIKYPVDLPTDNGQYRNVPLLRGISHVNLVDKVDSACADPDVWIDEGDFNGQYAKVKVCSKTGCPLDSVVYFYGR